MKVPSPASMVILNANSTASSAPFPLPTRSFPRRINIVNRITCHIRIRINPPAQPDGIGLDIPPGLGIVISKVVVMES